MRNAAGQEKVPVKAQAADDTDGHEAFVNLCPFHTGALPRYF
ncbi:hypothetical protein FACS1894196_4410 [Clostridia bacterium]|nr:hypothetical protein FACS1894196_4410 [Clostridia bacterium]